MAKPAKAAGIASGRCLCGSVTFEIDAPARWAWHDHSAASRRAHGAAYATYVGSWRKRFRVTAGEAQISHFEDAATKTRRSFCKRCGTPLIYERPRSPHMVNIPRALFCDRTGRQPRTLASQSFFSSMASLTGWTKKVSFFSAVMRAACSSASLRFGYS